MIGWLSAENRAGIDAAVDGALARIRRRSTDAHDGYAMLTAAVSRAATGGKRFRPANVVGAYLAFDGHDGNLAAVYEVAAAFELLHAAFVVHDDVIDHDVLRRGVPNIGGEFRSRAASNGADAAGSADLGDAAAILGGDLLLYEATRVLALLDLPTATRVALIDLFDDAVSISAAGELADVENAVAPAAADTASALATAHDKTAVYSFDAPLRAGALLAGASEPELEALRRAGGALGLAFQLVDDLIGTFGTAAQAGREAGGDLREAKRTPLVALAQQGPDGVGVAEALAIAHTGPVAVLAAQRALDASGARGQLRTLIDDALDAARTDAVTLPPAARALVAELAVRIAERVP